jgi:hypothetical protein
MILVLAAVLVTPFLPGLLKAKCPDCGKRKLETLELAQAGNKSTDPFIAYFSCGACHSKFMRNKSGPLQPMPDDAAVGIF